MRDAGSRIASEMCGSAPDLQVDLSEVIARSQLSACCSPLEVPGFPAKLKGTMLDNESLCTVGKAG
jgi:hypothetical protein